MGQAGLSARRYPPSHSCDSVQIRLSLRISNVRALGYGVLLGCPGDDGRDAIAPRNAEVGSARRHGERSQSIIPKTTIVKAHRSTTTGTKTWGAGISRSPFSKSRLTRARLFCNRIALFGTLLGRLRLACGYGS